MWLKILLGFNELKEAIHKNIELNNKEYHYGTLETLSLKDLRDKVKNSKAKRGKLKIRAIQADARALHLDKGNTNAASQFNLLEMVGANVTPDDGIERYEYDHTQGPK